MNLWQIADNQFDQAYWHMAMYNATPYSPDTEQEKRNHLKAAHVCMLAAEKTMRVITGYTGRLAKRKPIDFESRFLVEIHRKVYLQLDFANTHRNALKFLSA